MRSNWRCPRLKERAFERQFETIAFSILHLETSKLPGRLQPSAAEEQPNGKAPMPVVESLAKASQLPTGSFPALGDLHYSASRA